MSQLREIELPMWAGYPRGRGRPAAGAIELIVSGKRTTDRQRAAIRAIRRDARRMQPIVLAAALAAYPTLRRWNPRPKTIDSRGLARRIYLRSINVTDDHHDGVSYVMYGFGCDWDPSGFEIVMHRDRVIAAGGILDIDMPFRDPMRGARAAKWPTAAQRRAARKRARTRAKRNPKLLPVDLEAELEIVLPAWAGFVDGPDQKPATGEILLDVGGDSPAAPGPVQQAAYRRVLASAGAMQRAVLDALVAAYPKLTHGRATPATIERADIQNLVELRSVHIHTAVRGGDALVGYQLACAWDTEHGAGVLTHRERVLEVGQADVSFMASVARRRSR